MRKREVKRKLLALFERKQEIRQQGRLIQHVMNELSIGNDRNMRAHNAIRDCLEEFADEGTIKLYRTGKVLNGYRVTQRPKDAAPAPKPRSDQPATLPALPDLSTSPQEVSNEMPDEKKPDLSRAELVTLALHALQEAADERGHLYVPSSAQIIADSLGVSIPEANELNRPLATLGLRTSPRGRNPRFERPHLVSLEAKVVTEAMLESVRGARTLRSKDSQVPGLPVEADQLVEIIELLEQQVAELTAQAAGIDDLLAVISQLEEARAEDAKAMAEAGRVLEVKVAEVAKLTTERDALRSEVDSLRAQVLQKVVPSPKVAEVLKRYGRESEA